MVADLWARVMVIESLYKYNNSPSCPYAVISPTTWVSKDQGS